MGTKFDLPPHLMHQDRMVGWCTLFLTIVGKEAPANALEEDHEERERHQFWKSKKWAYANLNRLFVRFVPMLQAPRILRRQLLIVSKIRQSQHEPEERFLRDGRVLKIVPCKLCSRDTQRLFTTNREVGIEDSMAQQAILILLAQLPRRMCQAEVHVEPSQAAYGHNNITRTVPDPLPE